MYANGSHARVTVGWHLRDQVRTAPRAGHYDVVHVHGPLAPILPILAVEEADCPVVGTFHTPLSRHLAYEYYFQRLLDRLDAAVAVSDQVLAFYATVLGAGKG